MAERRTLPENLPPGAVRKRPASENSDPRTEIPQTRRPETKSEPGILGIP